jgi:predicted lysophospholipase L1 biosynthesis ABC-type transport system permease subunit
LNESQLEYLENLEKESKIIISKKIQTYSTIFDNKNNPDLVSLVFVDDKYPLY